MRAVIDEFLPPEWPKLQASGDIPPYAMTRPQVRCCRPFGLLLLVAITAFSNGCLSPCYLAGRTLVGEPSRYSIRVDGKRSLALYRSWAEHEWLQAADSCASDCSFTPDYHAGFVDGFVGYVYAGGSGEPPPVPPREYWNISQRSPRGKERVNQWFTGYRHGARVAHDGGYRSAGTIETSLACEAPHGPQSAVNNADQEPAPLNSAEQLPTPPEVNQPSSRPSPPAAPQRPTPSSRGTSPDNPFREDLPQKPSSGESPPSVPLPNVPPADRNSTPQENPADIQLPKQTSLDSRAPTDREDAKSTHAATAPTDQATTGPSLTDEDEPASTPSQQSNDAQESSGAEAKTSQVPDHVPAFPATSVSPETPANAPSNGTNGQPTIAGGQAVVQQSYMPAPTSAPTESEPHCAPPKNALIFGKPSTHSAQGLDDITAASATKPSFPAASPEYSPEVLRELVH